MRKHLQGRMLALGLVALLFLGLGVAASPTTLTVTPYTDLVRFLADGSVKALREIGRAHV